MKLPHKNGERLATKHFKKVTSEAALSIDFSPQQKIIEIEYTTGKIYHYMDMNKKIWEEFLEHADKLKGLGAFINIDFKKLIEEHDYDYYELTLARLQ